MNTGYLPIDRMLKIISIPQHTSIIIARIPKYLNIFLRCLIARLNCSLFSVVSAFFIPDEYFIKA